jgi:prepilin-type N-terminal cleavage/methylation domain-containing protein
MTIKYLQRLKSKKGITLVEMVIAMAIFTMLLAAVFSMYQPVVDIANMVTGDSVMQRVVTANEQFVIQQLRSSPEIDVRWNVGGAGIVTTRQADAATAFRNGRTADNLPQALVLHDGRIYNVRLHDAAPPGTAITPAMLTDPRWRVFNESFYSDVRVEFEVAITPPLYFDQRRGHVWLQMQADGLRRGRDGGWRVDMNSRRLSDTQLTWIGNVGSSDTIDVGPLRARSTPLLRVCSGSEHSSNCTCVTRGTVVILYLGNMDFTADIEPLRCAEPPEGCGRTVCVCD